ncbi:MAG: FABP family protein, partial [Acidimicrobiia bacterium]|nr:FABP family protein [Acidimicrobiia bacterium]
PAGSGRLEVVLSHPSGLLELQLGTINGSPAGGGAVIELRSSAVVGTPTAKSVTEVHRRFELSADGQVISYDVSMAAMGLPLTHHLHAELRRQA